MIMDREYLTSKDLRQLIDEVARMVADNDGPLGIPIGMGDFELIRNELSLLAQLQTEITQKELTSRLAQLSYAAVIGRAMDRIEQNKVVRLHATELEEGRK